MVNAVPADASSSASVNTAVTAIEHTSSETIKFILSGDVSIVTRPCYCRELFAITGVPYFLTENETGALYCAARCFLAEKQAALYLNRAEHSYYQLTLKLTKKGYTAQEYVPALGYLVHTGVLDDARFAGAWLYTRHLSKSEGYARLFAELRKRGVAAVTAKAALADFLSETDESTLCHEALKKLLRKGYQGDKLFRALQRKGFPFSMIKHCIAQLCGVQADYS